jgi:hypothetical protein
MVSKTGVKSIYEHARSAVKQSPAKVKPLNPNKREKIARVMLSDDAKARAMRARIAGPESAVKTVVVACKLPNGILQGHECPT